MGVRDCELANFGKAEIALIKAFISAKVDRYRPSYGRVVESYPRQCVMVGTTNESISARPHGQPALLAGAGARINIPWLRERRDQLFAEAYALYLQGVPFVPEPAEEARLFVPMQESRLVETAVMSELLNVLTREPTAAGIGAVVNELTEFVTMAQLVTALGVDAAKSSAALEAAQVRAWLEHEGWERSKRQVNGVRAWGYTRPRDWPPIDHEQTTAAQGAPGASGAMTTTDDDALSDRHHPPYQRRPVDTACATRAAGGEIRSSARVERGRLGPSPAVAQCRGPACMRP